MKRRHSNKLPPTGSTDDTTTSPKSRRCFHREQHFHLHQRSFRARWESPPRLASHYDDDSETSNVHDSASICQAAGLLASNAPGYPTTFLPSTIPLIIDTGASIMISPDKRDFIGPIQPVQPTMLKGIGAGLQVHGLGRAEYHFPAPTRKVVQCTLDNVLYVPDCTVRFLCPRHLAASTNADGDGFVALQHRGILCCHGIDIPVTYDSNMGLPVIYSIGSLTSAPITFLPKNLHATTALSTDNNPSSVLSSRPYQNLSQPQHLKLLMHERCNHRHMAEINSWIQQGLLPVPASIANCPDPICHACQIGKAKKKAHNRATGGITAHDRAPGDGVSADQLEAGCPGKIPTTKGLPTSKRYKYCNLWIDHATHFVFPTFHETKHATELIASKRDFEHFASRFNIRIKKIRADNGVYSAALFQHDCDLQNQQLSFCAVGSHWQNGVAERHIGLITQTARTLLLHATSKWPSVLNEEFWPFAIKHACAFHNASVHSDTKQTPYYAFTGEQPPCQMQAFRVFGCPVYVLDKRLQDGDSLSKWKARSWTGVYVGSSSQHAEHVPLIYNPQTTHVTPQFHVTFDDSFSTVSVGTARLSDATYQQLYESEDWLFKSTFHFDVTNYLFDDYWQKPLALGSVTPPKRIHHQSRKLRPVSPPIAYTTTTAPPSIPMRDGEHASLPCGEHAAQQPGDHASPPAGDHAAQRPGKHASLTGGDHAVSRPGDYTHSAGDHAVHHPDNNASPHSGDHSMQRCGNQVGPFASVPKESTPITNDDESSSSKLSSTALPYINLIPSACSASLSAYMLRNGINVNVYTAHSSKPMDATSASELPQQPPGISADCHLLSSTLEQSSPQMAPPEADNKNDILTQGQMLKTLDKPSFLGSQIEEMKSLQDLDIMDIHSIATLPPRARLLSSIWSYRRKRLPNGVLLKYKARLCVNGKEQAFGRDYWETYAPVAAWSTIRLLLYLSTILNLNTRQVDYTSAFPQADLDVPVYMKVPQGWFVTSTGHLQQHHDPKFQDSSYYLKLKKNLYGCKQAARNWFRHLKDGLLNAGFRQSDTDSCLFLRADCIIVVYVDDCLFFSPDAAVINDVIKRLSETLKLNGTLPLKQSLSLNQVSLSKSSVMSDYPITVNKKTLLLTVYYIPTLPARIGLSIGIIDPLLGN
jgi:hypothetical protein